VRNSVYGNLVLAGREAAGPLYENGLPVSQCPARGRRESCHYALLEHPRQGPCYWSVGAPAQRRGSAQAPPLERVDYVELDPEILALASATNGSLAPRLYIQTPRPLL